MDTKPWTADRRRQLTHDTLVDAASHLFATKGFHGASLDEIAQAAGFTKGAIYSNFAGKDGLLLAVVERHMDRLFEAYQRFTEPGTTDPAEVAAQWAQVVDEDPALQLLTLELEALAMRDEGLRARVAIWHQAYVDRVVESGVADRTLAVISLAVAWNLWHFRAIDREHADDYEEAFRRFIEMFLVALDGGV